MKLVAWAKVLSALFLIKEECFTFCEIIFSQFHGDKSMQKILKLGHANLSFTAAIFAHSFNVVFYNTGDIYAETAVYLMCIM